MPTQKEIDARKKAEQEAAEAEAAQKVADKEKTEADAAAKEADEASKEQAEKPKFATLAECLAMERKQEELARKEAKSK